MTYDFLVKYNHIKSCYWLEFQDLSVPFQLSKMSLSDVTFKHNRILDLCLKHKAAFASGKLTLTSTIDKIFRVSMLFE